MLRYCHEHDENYNAVDGCPKCNKRKELMNDPVLWQFVHLYDTHHRVARCDYCGRPNCNGECRLIAPGLFN
jgi:hypothetical protein